MQLALFWPPAHHVLVRSEDGGGDDAQEQAQHVEHHRSPQQTVQVDHIPAAADPGEGVVLCVELRAARCREQESQLLVKWERQLCKRPCSRQTCDSSAPL